MSSSSQEGSTNLPEAWTKLGLKSDLLENMLLQRPLWKEPTEIQSITIPHINDGANVIGQSRTGSGKTGAFLLPSLQKIDMSLKATQLLIMAPTQELANQISVEVSDLAKHMVKRGLIVLNVMKGVYDTIFPDSATLNAFTDAQRAQILSGQKYVSEAQVVVATPGSLLKFVQQRALSLNQLRVLVLDEADMFLKEQQKSGRGSDGIVSQTKTVINHIPQGCQRLLFSATFPVAVQNLAKQFAPNAKVFLFASQKLSKIDTISQFYIRLPDADKSQEQQNRQQSLQRQYDALKHLCKTMEGANTIIFVERRDDVRFLHDLFKRDGSSILPLHGDLEPQIRMEIVDKFVKGEAKILIATNVASRGLDFPQVSLVVNFHMPRDRDQPDKDTFIHRCGRTGRAGRVGAVVSIVSDMESAQALQYFRSETGYEVQQLTLENAPQTLQSAIKLYLERQAVADDQKSQEATPAPAESSLQLVESFDVINTPAAAAATETSTEAPAAAAAESAASSSSA